MDTIKEIQDEQAKGIHSMFNACMYREECREKDAEIERLRGEIERLKRRGIEFRREALDLVRAELVEIGLLPTERGWIEHDGRRDTLTLEAEIMFLRESGYRCNTLTPNKK